MQLFFFITTLAFLALVPAVEGLAKQFPSLAAASAAAAKDPHQSAEPVPASLPAEAVADVALAPALHPPNHEITAATNVSTASSNETAGPLVTIPLDKQYVPVVRNNKIVSYKTAYFGRVFLGSPQQQNFTVVFDTGSGHLFLPSSRCVAETCLKHNRYNRSASTSAMDLNHEGQEVAPNSRIRDQVNIAYGTGEVTGEFVRETICLQDHSDQIDSIASSPKCVRLRVITATQLTKEPFNTFKFDGVLGLGLDSLAVDPEFSFFGQFAKMNKFAEDSFGYFLSRTDAIASEISFGGHDSRRMSSNLQWVPVHKPELGFWQMKVKSVSVAGESIALCTDGDCVAIADTGTSLIGAPRPATQRLHWLLARKVPDDPAEIDCRTFPGPDLIFELEGGINITVGPEDYSRATAMRVLQTKTNSTQVICRASLLPVDGDEVLGPKAWILGEPVLRKYYTAYDWKRQQVGFALAKQPEIEAEPHQVHSVYDPPPPELPTPTQVVV
mmetsp:Transcript_70598/g.147871  ORF Transcript_70598/g.147871 Transcript_70598/m.147871 type:complete len:499 (-) Transcript_70598:394-1890(-)|eukprot:CAMPEP_0206523894 /NCGR_PEP_ID=MMETSP0324_2-20121206/67893_1 /ASSEMBLY_ACC=CAM_ASM_000836 /TAXON_ID=2866 /ORGANISM="Crypthecodinium cohnii, Strain Seligo" /LENGTH=498 /DNA_ID=CAMNT_0054018423 /DNA_START=75 /DNA_END=1571 /DNA_ORIENTATION=-